MSNYQTQAGNAVYAAAQKQFWNDDALKIADDFECEYDDIADEMIVTEAKVKTYTGTYFNPNPDAPEREFVGAYIEFMYDIKHDGVVSTYQSWGVLDIENNMYDGMEDARKREKLIRVRPATETAEGILSDIKKSPTTSSPATNVA